MSDTVGTIVIVVGIAVSLVGFWFLARTKRQLLGLLLLIVGFTAAGSGLLTVEDTTVEERPTPTVEIGTPIAATPES